MPAPTVTGVNPNQGPINSSVTVVITGTNFVNGGAGAGASVVSFGGLHAIFDVNSDTQITAFSPSYGSDNTVHVLVTNATGTSTPGAADQFTYAAAVPTVTGLGSNSGPIEGGTVVPINGTRFLGTTDVTFGGTNAEFTINSATQITAIAPGNAAGTVDVLVTNAEGTSSAVAADEFSYVPAIPTVTRLGTGSGPIEGGTLVTITGTNFLGTTAVTFGGTTAEFTVNSATQITAFSPANPAGTVDVLITNGEGTSTAVLADEFSYVAAIPTVTGLGSNSGPIEGGTVVTISGTNFLGTTAVTFGGRNAEFTINSATQITAFSPAHAAGTVDIVVTNGEGTSLAVPADHFNYVPAVPVVSGLSTNTGPSGGSTTVRISGTNFLGAVAVTFGGSNANFNVDSATQITAFSPQHGAGAVDILITNGEGTSAAIAADRFTYTP